MASLGISPSWHLTSFNTVHQQQWEIHQIRVIYTSWLSLIAPDLLMYSLQLCCCFMCVTPTIFCERHYRKLRKGKWCLISIHKISNYKRNEIHLQYLLLFTRCSDEDVYYLVGITELAWGSFTESGVTFKMAKIRIWGYPQLHHSFPSSFPHMPLTLVCHV